MSNEVWVPYQLEFLNGDSDSKVEWVDRRDLRFIDPFFDDTIKRNLENLRRVATPARALLRFLDDGEAPEPSGFIFHATRSGSTVISQMLTTDPHNLVFSEPDAPAAALWAKDRLNFAEKLAYFSALMRAYARAMTEHEKRYFVKFGIAVGWLKWIRTAFPRTPCLFVYRSPREIVASNLREPPLWLRGVSDHRAALTQTLSLKFELVAESFENQPDGLTLINYSEIDENFPSTLVTLLNLPNSKDNLRSMEGALKWYAKDPAQPWTANFASRKPIIVPDGPDLLELETKYQKLERLRLINDNKRQFSFPMMLEPRSP